MQCAAFSTVVLYWLQQVYSHYLVLCWVCVTSDYQKKFCLYDKKPSRFFRVLRRSAEWTDLEPSMTLIHHKKTASKAAFPVSAINWCDTINFSPKRNLKSDFIFLPYAWNSLALRVALMFENVCGMMNKFQKIGSSHFLSTDDDQC